MEGMRFGHQSGAGVTPLSCPSRWLSVADADDCLPCERILDDAAIPFDLNEQQPDAILIFSRPLKSGDLRWTARSLCLQTFENE
jgi:hypothetical protein